MPGYEAPVYIGWAQTNCSALIRIPRYTEDSNKSILAELRFPDPSSNPYLAFNGMLAAGLDSIEKEMTPPDPLNNINLFELSHEERFQMGISELPGSLPEALTELDRDVTLNEMMGPTVYEAFARAKWEEWNEYLTHVSDFEDESRTFAKRPYRMRLCTVPVKEGHSRKTPTVLAQTNLLGNGA